MYKGKEVLLGTGDIKKFAQDFEATILSCGRNFHVNVPIFDIDEIQKSMPEYFNKNEICEIKLERGAFKITIIVSPKESDAHIRIHENFTKKAVAELHSRLEEYFKNKFLGTSTQWFNFGRSVALQRVKEDMDPDLFALIPEFDLKWVGSVFKG